MALMTYDLLFCSKTFVGGCTVWVGGFAKVDNDFG